MKLIYSIFGILLTGMLTTTLAQQKETPKKNASNKVIVAYVTSWGKTLPDPKLVTHINYAFGHVNKTFDGVTIENEGRLKDIVALKSKYPQLKVLLSIG